MRNRKDIEEEYNKGWRDDGYSWTHGAAEQVTRRLTLEALLDIRELLVNPPIEITHTPVSEKKDFIDHGADDWGGFQK